VSVSSLETAEDSNIQDVYPLTPMQGGILFHVLKEERPGPYIEQFVFEADRTPDPERLGAAWAAVIRRHPALRTAFVWEGVGQPLQIVTGECSAPVECRDLTGMEQDQVEAAVQEFLTEDRHRGIALAAAPLMRHTILVHDRGCVVVWTLHHLIMDGWSMPITIAEVAAHYRAETEGSLPDLHEPRPFRDYVSWLGRNQTPALEAFWRQRLEGVRPTPVRLRTPAPMAERAGTASAGRAYIDLSSDLSAALAATAREARVTLSTIFTAAWSVLLARHTDTDDVVFGAAVSGRPAELSGVEDMVGVFINTIPRWVQVDGTAEVGAWLREVQRDYLDTLPHQHAGLPDILRFAGLPGTASLFDSIVVFENYPSENPDFDLGDGLSLRVREIIEDAGFPLTLTVLPRHPRIRLQLLYMPALFTDEMISTLLGRFEAVLAALTDGLDRKVGRLGAVGWRANCAIAEEAALEMDAATASCGAASREQSSTLAEQDLFDRPAARVLRDLWMEILGRPTAAPGDDFFRVGGDSLAAVRLIGKLRMLFQAPVPVDALFKARSLANLLEVIDNHVGGAQAADAIASAQA
jgi:acyl carrier protein